MYANINLHVCDSRTYAGSVDIDGTTHGVTVARYPDDWEVEMANRETNYLYATEALDRALRPFVEQCDIESVKFNCR